MKIAWLTIGCGRGPTRFISPRSTLTSCGSSSRRKRRSQPPTRVMRWTVVQDPFGCVHVGRVHRAELQQPERLSVAAGALLHEEDRAARIELDERARSARSSGARAPRADDGGDDAHDAGDGLRRAVIAESLGQNQRARPHRLDRHLPGQPLVELERVLDDDAADARLEQRLQRQMVAPVLEGDHDAIGARRRRFPRAG